MRDKPAVVYPASMVDSVVVRADIESASLMRPSLQAATLRTPNPRATFLVADKRVVGLNLRPGHRVLNKSNADNKSNKMMGTVMGANAQSPESPRLTAAFGGNGSIYREILHSPIKVKS